MRHAVWLPLFDAFADPANVAGLAATAEAAGWDGVFVWDHIRWRERDRHVGDAWISLASAALSTERLRLGAAFPAVVPSVRQGRILRGRLGAGGVGHRWYAPMWMSCPPDAARGGSLVGRSAQGRRGVAPGASREGLARNGVGNLELSVGVNVP